MNSVYAEEGTRAHECLEILLKTYLENGNVRVKKEKLKKEYPLDMIEHVWEAFRFITERFEKCDNGSILHSEVRLYNKSLHPEMFGTTDAAIVEEYGWLEVIDFKYGAGIAVDVKENTQLIQYAMGLLDKYEELDFKGVRLIVVQPRAEHADGPIRMHEMSLEEIFTWHKTFKAGVQRALHPKPAFKAGSHCHWCPAKIKCPEISKKAIVQAQAEFGDIPDTKAEIEEKVKKLSPKELSNILTGLDKVDVWAKAVREYAEEELNKGTKIEGYKLVWKRAQRKWADEEKVKAEALKKFGKKALSEPELLSPAQLEKATGKEGKEWVLKRVTEVSTGTTMVPESDKREAVTLVTDGF